MPDDEGYTLNNMKIDVDMADITNAGEAGINLDIKAEDGSKKVYTIAINKISNLELESVVIDSEEILYNEELSRFEKLVQNGANPEIVITAENKNQIVRLLDEDGNQIAEGIGILRYNAVLSTDKLEDNYIIKVISHNGEDVGSKSYNLKIRQKSTETGISYAKVDGLGMIESEDGLEYHAEVSRTDEHDLKIKLKDENASVKILDLERKYSFR